MPRECGDVRGQVHQRRPLARGHAGGGLVHEKELGLAGQRDGELHPLHVAIGERRAGHVRRLRHADLGEQLHGLVAMALPGRRPERAALPPGG